MIRPLALTTLILTAVGCVSAGPPQPTVQVVNPNQKIRLSGKWNDTDANDTAKKMISDCLSRPWAAKFKAKNGRDPVIKLYPMKNRTDEHINTKFFTKQIERQILNSGIAEIVSASDETQEARDERRDQAKHASSATKKENQQETGTDFFLNGWITFETDSNGGTEVRAILVTMQLTHAQTQRKVWIGEHKIKKIITRADSSWQ